MPFEVFDKRTAAVSKSPFVTVQKNNGPLSMNRPAYELMDKPEAVELLFDREEQLIGFHPVPITSPKAFPVRPQGKNSATLMVAGQSFTKHYGIDTRVARRYPVEMRDDVLVVDLKGESVEVRSPGRRSEAEITRGAR
jgi:hypothetical protein